MKILKNILSICLITTYIISINSFMAFSLDTLPTNAIIKTSNLSNYKLTFLDTPIEINKIISNIGIGYSLEKTKKIPSGETFTLIDETPKIAKKILYTGYPNISYIDLNLNSHDDAYVATQIALWCAIENLDISNIKGGSTRLINAINKIYTEALNLQDSNVQLNYGTYYKNDKIQQIIMIFKN